MTITAGSVRPIGRTEPAVIIVSRLRRGTVVHRDTDCFTYRDAGFADVFVTVTETVFYLSVKFAASTVTVKSDSMMRFTSSTSAEILCEPGRIVQNEFAPYPVFHLGL